MLSCRKKVKKRTLRAGIAALLSCTALISASGGIHAASPPFLDATAQNIVLDAGPPDTLTKDGLPLETTTIYSAERGYGWLDPDKERVFVTRDGMERSRDAFTIDSIEASSLDFRIDLPVGDWLVRFWAEAGLEYINTATFKANGIEHPLNWYEFAEPSEPSTQLRRGYRLYQKVVKVGNDGLVLNWQGGKDKVRLNGLQFIPAPESEVDLADIKDTKIQILLRVKEAGRYNSTVSLDAIVRDLEKTLATDPNNLVAAYWLPQVETLARAEEYFEGLRGWEWARKKTGLSMFGRYNQAIMLLDGLLASADSNHLLYERVRYQRGRILYWLDREGHGQHYDGWLPEDLRYLAQRHPNDNLLAMYTGAKIDTPDACDFVIAPETAPNWSLGQSEVLCRTKLLSNWWVTERQNPNGELGGKYGDDVEMLRWWSIPFLAGDAVTSLGWKTLATGVWSSDRLEDGYYKNASDVEHAAEPISDTAPLLSYLNEPEYTARLSNSARHFLERWTVRTPDGKRYFRSAWFGAHTIDERPPRNRDVPMNGRAAKAVKFYAWNVDDPALHTALHEWARAWADAAMSTDKGKPKGVVPASLRASDQSINGDEPNWYDANMFWEYFNWSHESGQQIYDLLLFAAQLTGDETLLAPLYASADLVEKHLKQSGNSSQTPAPGSEAWAASHLAKAGGFWSVLSQWRLLYDKPRYDDLLKSHGGAYIKFRLTGDEKHLAEAATPILDEIRYNFPMRTDEALFTDRVYISKTNATPEILGMLTGSLRTSAPYAAITWQNTPAGFSALVRDNGKDRLVVDAYLSATANGSLNFRLWQLDTGLYDVHVQEGSGGTVTLPLSIETAGQLVSIPAEAEGLYKISISRKAAR
ncbi:hypothetical protein [Kordiimonas sp.]|uniref:hypothetical protein n=1 Tax=Kordiimonas sp. TaxID=1970157 RepID=UPI003A93DD91